MDGALKRWRRAAITGYQITNDNWATKADKAANELTHTFTNLINGTQYTFKIRAVNSAGNSAEVTATATPVTEQLNAPKPSASNEIDTNNNILLVFTWETVTSATGYKVAFTAEGKSLSETVLTAGYNESGVTLTENQGVMTLTITGITQGTLSGTVKAVNSDTSSYIDSEQASFSAKAPTLGLTYYKDNNDYWVTGIGTATAANIIIPSVYQGLPVTSINYGAFYNCSNLLSIEISKSVKTIANNTFENCTNLKSVTFADGSLLTNIGNYAFYNCSNLVNIEIPQGITNIDNCAFSGCLNLVSIEIPQGVTSINLRSFANCKSLRSITFAGGSLLTSIGNSAFETCENLVNIEIPQGVTNIDDYAFFGCTNLGSITFADDRQLISIGNYVFYNCTELKTITIPQGVTNIGDGAFSNWTDTQTIYVEGFANESEADLAWGAAWRNNCSAKIEYLG